MILLYEREVIQLQKEKAEIEATISDIDKRLAAAAKSVADFQSLADYCARVHDALSTFSFDEKRLALEAVGVKVQFRGNEWSLETRIPTADEKPVGKVTALPTRRSTPSGRRATSSKPAATR